MHLETYALFEFHWDSSAESDINSTQRFLVSKVEFNI